MSIPSVKIVQDYESIYRAHREKDYIQTLQKVFAKNFELPEEYSVDVPYLDHLEYLIDNAYKYACCSRHKKAMAYYKLYREKFSNLYKYKDKILQVVSEIQNFENQIDSFDGVWYELSRMMNSSDQDYKYLYDRIRHYKENTSKKDIVSRRNILSMIVESIRSQYDKECKKISSSDSLNIKRDDKRPGVKMDTIEGKYSIFGRSYATTQDKFWVSILNWSQSKKEHFGGKKLVVNMDYYDGTSATYLFKLLRLFIDNGGKIVWRYDQDDDSTRESGEDFEDILCSKFEFIANDYTTSYSNSEY